MAARAAAVIATVALVLAGRQPVQAAFGPAKTVKLANGAIVASQNTPGGNLINAQIFVPTGLISQPASAAGVAGVVARMVLATPVEGQATVTEVAARLGAAVDFTLEPDDSRFSIECRPDDFPRLLRDLAVAIQNPSRAAFAAARNQALEAADRASKNPVLAVYGMVRQVRYSGTGYAFPDGGSAVSLRSLAATDASRFAGMHLHGQGTIVALVGDVRAEAIEAAQREFGSLPPTANSSLPVPPAVRRRHEVVAHRVVEAPWVGLGFDAPSQFSRDFPAMLVIQALLGRPTNLEALAQTSSGSAAGPEAFVGPFYQYAAQPGTLAFFLGGANADIDQSITNLELAVGRLRTKPVSPVLMAQARRVATGDFYMQFVEPGQVAWLLGRSAGAPQGPAYENGMAGQIAVVSPADVQRVARRYLTNEVVAVLLPREDVTPANP